ncbi:SHOCT domain-containing protein [Streptomyces sp. NPDC002004]
MMWYGWGWGNWPVAMVITLLFWVLLIAGVIALVHRLTSPRRSSPPGPAGPGWGGRRAEDVLAERFARVEVGEDEYERRLALLREHQ